VTTNQLFGVPYSGKTRTGAQPLVSRGEGRRWLWLTLAATGALLSFSVAVGWQAWSNGRSHDDDDDAPIVHNEAPRRLGRIAAETEVGSVVEIKRPLIVPRESLAPQPVPVPAPVRRTPPVVDARPEVRPSEVRPKPVRTWEAKPPRSDLKNPFR
jgi:hypothetical protein